MNTKNNFFDVNNKKTRLFKDVFVTFFKNKIKNENIKELENNFSFFYLKENINIFDKKFNNKLILRCKKLNKSKSILKNKFKINIIKESKTKKFKLNKSVNIFKKSNFINCTELNMIYNEFYKKDFKNSNIKIKPNDIKIYNKLKSFDKYTLKNKKIKRLNLNIIPKYLYDLKYLRKINKNNLNFDQIDSIFKDRKNKSISYNKQNIILNKIENKLLVVEKVRINNISTTLKVKNNILKKNLLKKNSLLDSTNYNNSLNLNKNYKKKIYSKKNSLLDSKNYNNVYLNKNFKKQNLKLYNNKKSLININKNKLKKKYFIKKITLSVNKKLKIKLK